MKYSIFGFNQELVVNMTATKEVKGKMVTLKLDVSDLLILHTIADFMNRPKIQKTIIDDKIYCWVKHSVILEDLPILNIKQQAFADKLEKLVIFGLLEKKAIRSQSGTMSYFRIGANYEKLLYSDSKCSEIQSGTCSELHLRTCSELHNKDYTTNDYSTNDSILEPLAASDETPTPSFKVSYKEIVDKYNSLFNGKLPKVTAITDKRKKAIKARVTEFGIESIDTVFNNIAHSDFLLGRNDKNWQCDFDWIFRPTSYVKILEGNYKNKTGCIISTEYDNAEAGSQIAKCIEWMQIYTPRLLNLKGVIDEEGFERMRKTCKKGEFKKRLEIMNTDESITENMNIVEAFVNYGIK